ncbi:OAM dimerization domain-containing protein, partial [Bacillus altitudinis]
DGTCALDPAKLIDGCTFEDPSKIIYIDELDDMDNVNVRLKEVEEFRNSTKIKPEMEWCADGTVMLTMMLPTDKRTAEFAALEFAKKMNLEDPEVISREVMHSAEGTRIEIKGKVPFSIDIADLIIPEEQKIMTDEEIRADIEAKPFKIV